MFDLYTDFDPITPATDALLAVIGVDRHAVRETLLDDYARRCPDREVLAGGRSRESGEKGERRRGRSERFLAPGRSHPIVINPT